MDIDKINSTFSGASAADILAWAASLDGVTLSLACSFSPEDIAIIHHIRQAKLDIGVFAIDTGRLHEETYECAERVRTQLDVKIEWYFPQSAAVETLERNKGLYSFRNNVDDRHECCGIRKVEPLNRALSSLDGWITGQRRDQSVTRTELDHVSIDQGHQGILKLNPLASWSEEQLWDFIKSEDLPYNRLHDKDFPSIGCAPCTRAVREGSHPRTGRWWWEDPENKECGLHLAPPS